MFYNPAIGIRSILLCLLLFSPIHWVYGDPGLSTATSAIQTVRLSGYTRARTVLDLASEASGKVETVNSEIGQAIDEKGIFACLDRTFINLDIRSNQAEIAKTQIDIDYFVKQVERYRKLVLQNSSSQQQLDDLQRSLGSARQQLKLLNTRKRELHERKKRFCVSAPEGWVIMDRYIEPGEWVQSGDPVAKVGNFNQLLIPFALSMAEYKALLEHRDELEITLPELGISRPARLERVSPAFDEKSRKIILDLEITGDSPEFRGGIRADLMLRLPGSTDSVILPRAAVEERYEQHWVERPNGERISVVFLGPAGMDDAEVPLVRISHPDIEAGQQFILKDR